MRCCLIWATNYPTLQLTFFSVCCCNCLLEPLTPTLPPVSVTLVYASERDCVVKQFVCQHWNSRYRLPFTIYLEIMAPASLKLLSGSIFDVTKGGGWRQAGFGQEPHYNIFSNRTTQETTPTGVVLRRKHPPPRDAHAVACMNIQPS